MRLWVRTAALRLLAVAAFTAPATRADVGAPDPKGGAHVDADAKRAPPSGCAGWLARAVTLRAEQRLLDARDALARCDEARCDTEVRGACSRAKNELAARIPQLVLQVKTTDGEHIEHARAYVDGRPAAQGVPLELDPGPHSVRTQHDDYLGRQSQVTLAVGERRTLVVQLRERPQVIDDGASRARFSNWPMPEATWALVGASVGAFATAIVLDAYTADRVENLKRCAPNCDEALVSAVERDIQLSRLAAGLGVLSLATAAWIALAEGSGDGPAQRARYAPRLKVTGGPSGAKATLTARFDETDAFGLGSPRPPVRPRAKPGASPEFHPPRARTRGSDASEATTCSKGCTEPPPPLLDEHPAPR